VGFSVVWGGVGLSLSGFHSVANIDLIISFCLTVDVESFTKYLSLLLSM
jgi:hypothetical protein